MKRKKIFGAGVIFVGLGVAFFIAKRSETKEIAAVYHNWDSGISMEEIEVDVEYLNQLEEYIDQMQNEAGASIAQEYNEQELIDASEIQAYRIKYKSGEETIDGYIAYPQDYMEKKYPVLIYNRGGNRDYGELEPECLEYYARYGMIVLASQYRGGGESTGTDEFGGEDVNDVQQLIELAKNMNCSDGKIYMFGWSRGALETYVVLRNSSDVDAAVCGAGITDLSDFYMKMLYINNADMINVLDELVGNPADNPEEYKERSVIEWYGDIQAPLLIVHGDEDERVSYSYSEDLYEKCIDAGMDVEYVLYEGLDHSDPAWIGLDYYFYWLKQH